MQVLNVSYNDPQVKKAMVKACGQPFGLWEAIKRGGVGTARFSLVDGPDYLLELIDRTEDRGFCSLEVRKAGLVFRYRSRLETLATPIGYQEIQEAVLGSPGAGSHAPLLLKIATGERLLFSLRKEHWGYLRGLMERSMPEGRFRLSASSAL